MSASRIFSPLRDTKIKFSKRERNLFKLLNPKFRKHFLVGRFKKKLKKIKGNNNDNKYDNNYDNNYDNEE